MEPLNEAVLGALNGSAGEWRTGADVVRRIIVFSDESPADPGLADDVRVRASDIGAAVEEELGTPQVVATSGSTPLAFTASMALAEDGTAVPVEIFTVAVGQNQQAVTALRSLAEDTGGQFFTAAIASEVVGALLNAIQVPLVPVNSLPVAADDAADTLFETATTIDLIGNEDDPDDSLDPTTGDGILIGGPGNEILDGGASLDVAIFAGERAGFAVTQLGPLTTVSDTSGAEGNDELTATEILQFDDGFLDLRDNSFSDGFVNERVEAFMTGPGFSTDPAS